VEHWLVQFELLVLAVTFAVLLVVETTKYLSAQISPTIVPLLNRVNVSSRDVVVGLTCALFGYVIHDVHTHAIPVVAKLWASTSP
jgi:hypothetical protein